jgi:hypothetical protein
MLKRGFTLDLGAPSPFCFISLGTSFANDNERCRLPGSGGVQRYPVGSPATRLASGKCHTVMGYSGVGCSETTKSEQRVEFGTSVSRSCGRDQPLLRSSSAPLSVTSSLREARRILSHCRNTTVTTAIELVSELDTPRLGEVNFLVKKVYIDELSRANRRDKTEPALWLA